jgi:5'-nucleotidase
MKRWSLGVAGLFLFGCGETTGGGASAEDGPDDSFLAADGKADNPNGGLDAATACAVLKVAGDFSLEVLDVNVGLNRQAATSIINHRKGPDGVLGSRDDAWFKTLAELDAVKYVGPAAFKRLKDYVAQTGFACGDVSVQVLGFNDFHGNLKPPTGSSGSVITARPPAPAAPVSVAAGGVEYLATHIQNLAGTNPNTVVVAAGDIIGATPLISAIFHDEPSIEAMNILGLEIAAVGNHEFDKGWDELLRLQAGGCHPEDGCLDGDDFGGADFQYLAANVIVDETGETLLPSYEIRRFGAARIGFIGLTLEGTPAVTVASGVEGLTFLDEVETINAQVALLKAQGIEAIVVLIHEGGLPTGLYNGCDGVSGAIVDIVNGLDPAVDVVISGHTHQAYNCVINGKIVTSGAHAGRVVSDIDLVINEVTRDVVSMVANNVIVTRDVPKDPEETALIARYDALSAPLANRIIGKAEGDLTRMASPAGETTMGNVIADAQLVGTGEQGARAAFMNPGGVRADLLAAQSSGGEALGEITYGEAFNVQPFSNLLVTMDLTGAQLDTMLEQQWGARINLLSVSAGFRYAWSAGAPIGSRIDPASITLDGVPVDPAGTYRITVNAFLADGGDGFTVLRSGTHRVTGAVDVDVLEAYLTARNPLPVPALDRVTVLP